jgi:hypothetical protein
MPLAIANICASFVSTPKVDLLMSVLFPIKAITTLGFALSLQASNTRPIASKVSGLKISISS